VVDSFEASYLGMYSPSRVEETHRFGANYLIPFTAGCGSQNVDLPFSLWMGWVPHAVVIDAHGTSANPKSQMEIHVHGATLSVFCIQSSVTGKQIECDATNHDFRKSISEKQS